jgi:NAD(P)-dependent dehydrogenase (short-subunit alcohol dehydrogenase family)
MFPNRCGEVIDINGDGTLRPPGKYEDPARRMRQRFRRGAAHQDGAVRRLAGDCGRNPAAAHWLGAAAAEDRVAVVTGGNRGLGLALVRALAQRGMRVVMTTRSLDRGRAAVDRLGDLADRVAVRQLDVTDSGSVSRLVSWLERQLGHCDVLVNNAAVLIDDESCSPDTDLDIVQRTLETNLLGTWRLTQAIVPLMRRHHYGRIVNVSSALGSVRAIGPGLPAYRISQVAINALTRILAGDLADDGILVNACCPGAPRVTITHGRDAVEFTPLADTALRLATLNDDGPTGGFFHEDKAVEW